MAAPYADASLVMQVEDFIRQYIENLPARLDTFGPWHAALVTIPVGIVLLLYGFRLYRYVATVIFAAVGLLAGMAAAAAFDFSWLVGAAVGALVIGFLGWLLVRAAWSTVCGVVAAAAATVVWVNQYGMSRSATEVWLVGGAAFFIGGLIGFFFFRVAVILASSLQGASMIAWGALKLAALVPSIGRPIMAAIHQMPWLLGIAVLVPAIVGVVIQWRDTKSMPGEPRRAKKPAKKRAAEDE